ncbi:DUF4435 domain-containing protein [Rhizobium leguminosarum]|uniref:DUF4435 domain-containing protein n=1 Tax=Rhizobium leguminosarum TaxID=384 RepID=UPI0004A4D4D5|nr:DUF4435 domain-containing protein [Rhizobium leguminosarum]
MLSISRHMTAEDIAEEVRMERMVHLGSFLMVEGKTDIDRLAEFIDADNCSLVNCWGRRKLLQAFRLMTGRRRRGVVALVDADFDRIRGRMRQDPQIIYSVNHDFDLDWLAERCLTKYLLQVGDAEKVNACGGVKGIVEKILTGLKPISAARYLNDLKQIPYKVSGVRASDHFSNFSVNIDTYVNALTENYQASQADTDALKTKISDTAKLQFDLMQFTNGHDFHCALGVSLQSELGDRRGAHTFGSEVELHLRLIFSEGEFLKTDLFHKMAAWDDQNPAYWIMRKDLRQLVQVMN